MTKCWPIVVLAAACLALAITKAHAHDSWINKGNYKNKAGEWCCGDYDCKSYSETQSTAGGWIVGNRDDGAGKPEGAAKAPDVEFVPYDDPATIDKIVPPDGGVTICRRPDGSRRCVFGLKPGI